ncbi:unnamed protein product [Lota lota]
MLETPRSPSRKGLTGYEEPPGRVLMRWGSALQRFCHETLHSTACSHLVQGHCCCILTILLALSSSTVAHTFSWNSLLERSSGTEGRTSSWINLKGSLLYNCGPHLPLAQPGWLAPLQLRSLLPCEATLDGLRLKLS